MIALNLAPQEVETQLMTEEHLRAAADALQRDGFVILQDVIDVRHLDMLRERMLEDLEAILKRDDAPFNFNSGNVQQDPPPFPPYLFRDVLLNDFVIAVTREVLGPNLKNAYYSGNTSLPGGSRQPVHPDVAQLWPNLAHPTPAFGLVVNVPVVRVTPENGSTELWPGSHLDTQFDIHQGSLRIPEEALEKRRAVAPPIQPTVELGSAVIRDLRLWHAGMPNHTDQPRPMIAMIHKCSWWNDDEKVTFPQGTEEFFQHPVLRTNARFVPEVNHIMNNQAYDFQR